MKKLLKSISVLAVMCSLFIPVSAVSTNDKEEDKGIKYENGEIVIEVETDEEMQAVLDAIDKQSAEAERLWNQAVTESKKEENQKEVIIPNRTPRAYKVNSTSAKLFSMGAGNRQALLYFSATYETGKDYSGNSIISNVYYIQALPKDGTTKLTTDHSKHSLIDGKRTLAANFTLTAKVKNLVGDTVSKTFSVYVEFHVMGGSKVY